MTREGFHHKARKTNRYGPRYYGLTPRQLEALHYLCNGMTQEQVALKMGVSKRTINMHMAGVYKTLDCHTALAAVTIIVTRIIDNETRMMVETNARVISNEAIDKLKYLLGME